MKKLTDQQKIYQLKRSLWSMEKKRKDNKKVNTNGQQYVSIIINLFSEVTTEKCAIKKGEIVLKTPQEFSLIKNPSESLLAASKLANTVRNEKYKKFLVVDYAATQDMDLAAESVLGLIAKEIKKEYKNKKHTFSGFYPKGDRLERLVRGIGLIKLLNAEHEYLPEDQKDKINIFEKGNVSLGPRASGVTYAETVVKDFVTHINSCLANLNKKLTQTAIERLSNYTSEILDNVHEHSGGKPAWYVKGYYDYHDESKICEIAIFNFGNTIADTFKSLPKESYAYKMIEPYIKEHKSKNIFSSEWNEEDLLTVAALQGDTSCKNMQSTDTRGNGTIEMINFFDDISKECSGDSFPPEMAIISGATHIRFDGKYRPSEDANGKKTIAFNKENNLNEAPDKNYVSHLKHVSFPGTVISIKFLLADQQTEERRENEPNN